MRDMMVLLAMVLLVPLALRNTYVAFLLWGWAGLISLNAYLYGFMMTLPFVQTFAIICMVLLLVVKDPERRKFEFNPTTVMCFLLAVQALVSASFAYDGLPRNWELATNLLKTLLFCAFMPMLLTSRYRIHAFVVMMCVATGFHGVTDGLKFLSSGGSHLAQGIRKFGDNNHYAIVMVMIIPLMLYLARFTANKIARLGFVGAMVLAVLSVVATRSRGGLACMIIVAVWFILTSKRKAMGMIFIALAAVMVVQLAPSDWSSRMNTISDAGEDASFLGRVAAWRVSTAIALGNPLTGGGFHAVEIRAVWDKFKDAPNLIGSIPGLDMNAVHAAHSIYFETLGDLGFSGMAIFVAMLANAFFTARTVMREAQQAGPQLEWARSLAELTLMSVVAFASGGALLSAAYFELPYMLFMLLEVLRIQVRHEASKPGRIKLEKSAIP